MKKPFLLFALLAGCLDSTATSTDEQSVCTQEDQDAGNCPGGGGGGGGGGCTPIDYCVDADFQAGTCCVHHNHPANPTTVGQVQCGNDPTNNDQPICISTNKYDWGLVRVSCTSVTRWYHAPDGSVFSQTETECVLY